MTDGFPRDVSSRLWALSKLAHFPWPAQSEVGKGSLCCTYLGVIPMVISSGIQVQILNSCASLWAQQLWGDRTAEAVSRKGQLRLPAAASRRRRSGHPTTPTPPRRQPPSSTPS